jgi:hypothetical protein
MGFGAERAGEGFGTKAHVAQLAERVLGKDEVISSTLIMGSSSEHDNANATGQDIYLN